LTTESATQLAKKRILVISTGGTIGGNVRGASDESHVDGSVLLELVEKTADHLANPKQGVLVDLDLDYNDLMDVDSSFVQPSDWTKMAAAVLERYNDFDGFVITHGTNTLGYTASALSYCIGHSPKPIVITGAQIPASYPASDGVANLENAIRVAAGAGALVMGVSVVFGSHLITGVRAKKSTEFDLDAFATFTGGSIGRIGRILDINRANLDAHNELATYHRPSHRRFQGQSIVEDAALAIPTAFRTSGILSVTEFPGMSADMLSRATAAWLDTGEKQNEAFPGLEAVILRSFGAGDVSETLWPWLEDLKERSIPVVITTQAPNGRANFLVNDPGKHVERENLGLAAQDMSIESITTKLAWLLEQGFTYREIAREWTTNYRGEISEKLETKW
jgi:L-asparaginase